MPGWRFKLWPVFRIEEFPWVQVPAGEIGVVIAQVGAPLPVGAKSAIYHTDFGDFGNVETFLANGGGKGVQRPVLPPGTLAPIHPVAFMVITPRQVYGLPVSTDLATFGMDGKLRADGVLRPQSFGLDPSQLKVDADRPDRQRRHGRHRLRARGRPAAEGRHRRAASAATRTSRRWRRTAHRSPR